jgi:hypothetical protein
VLEHFPRVHAHGSKNLPDKGGGNECVRGGGRKGGGVVMSVRVRGSAGTLKIGLESMSRAVNVIFGDNFPKRI